jgi:phosphatidylglycerophosphate synthase
MLDPYLNPPLNTLGKKLVTIGLTANTMTLIGFLFGVAAILFILAQQYGLAAAFILCNRLADGLDGAIARHSQLTDFGGFLDIVCDFIIYAGIVFAFGMASPVNLPYAHFLIFSFIGPMTSFLAYAILASKRQMTTPTHGQKAFYYVGGLCEGTETAVILILFCLMPKQFHTISMIFAILCWLTTCGRLYRAWTDFGQKNRITSTDCPLNRL